MWKLKCVLVLLAGLAGVPALRPQNTSPSTLPDGPMQAKATTACAECHEASIIVQQRLTKAAWTKEVDKMIKWGAVVDPQDHDALVDYLSANLGVDKAEYIAARTSGAKEKKK